MFRTKLVLFLLVTAWAAPGCSSTRLLGRSGSDGRSNPASSSRAPSPSRDSLARSETRSDRKPEPEASEPQGTAVVHATGAADNRVTPAAAVADAGGRRMELDDIDGAQIVATVNGSPIFASEVLWSHRMRLAQAKLQLSPQQYDVFRLKLIAGELPVRIQNKVLVQGIKAPLTKEQWQQLEKQLDPIVQEELQRMAQDANVETIEQLGELMARQGASLELWSNDFRDVILAQQYLREKLEGEVHKIDRRDLLAYYEEHRQDYGRAARVRWQQIRITFAKHGGKTKAFDVLNQAVEQLRKGRDFAEVAKQFSDGPHAADGGHWDWTNAGSLANKEIEQALFELSVGQISQIYTFDDDFQIVRVVDRESAGYTPFEEVQSEIRTTLQKQAEQQAREKIVQELLDAAVVETIFDDADTPLETR